MKRIPETWKEQFTPQRAAVLVGLVTFALYLAAWGRMGGWFAGQLLEELRAEVELDATVRANVISSGVSRRLLLLESFAAFSEVMAAGQASESQMRFYVQTVYPTVDGIYALAVAPDGVIDFAFPEDSNTHLNRMDILNSENATVARAAQRAQETGDVVLVGPLELGSPQPVLLGIAAIYNEGDLWGFVVMTADLNPLLVSAGLTEEASALQVALRSGNGLLLFGEPAVLDGDPVLRRVEYPDGAWQLAAVPAGGWESAIRSELQAFRLALLLLGGGLAAAVTVAARRQFELSQTVEEKTIQAETAGQMERSRLARELHDSVSQALYGIALGARTLRKKVVEQHTADPALIEPVDYILSLAQGGLAEMRSLLMGLRPEEIGEQGLATALKQLAEGLAARHKIGVKVSAKQEPALGLEQKVALYRIAQEATHNIIKHAQAAHITLNLVDGSGAVKLEVIDDGNGFDPDGEFPGHLGLKTMRERAILAGANFALHSAPGKGTRIQVTVPVLDSNH